VARPGFRDATVGRVRNPTGALRAYAWKILANKMRDLPGILVISGVAGYYRAVRISLLTYKVKRRNPGRADLLWGNSDLLF
jgi:hypothetical protein